MRADASRRECRFASGMSGAADHDDVKTIFTAASLPDAEAREDVREQIFGRAASDISSNALRAS